MSALTTRRPVSPTITRPVPPWTCSTSPHIKAAASLTRNLAFPHQADHRNVQLARLRVLPTRSVRSRLPRHDTQERV